MVISGKACAKKSSVKETAEATVRVLRRTVPAAVPTINFLSGGQSSELATANLNEMNKPGQLPWNVSFSYARALQENCMKVWAGKPQNLKAAQVAFIKRAKLNSLAATGKYTEAMEAEEVTLA
jgi:fructose-bisphosphate aldolase class I